MSPAEKLETTSRRLVFRARLHARRDGDRFRVPTAAQRASRRFRVLSSILCTANPVSRLLAPLSLGLQGTCTELLDGALDSLAAFPKASP